MKLVIASADVSHHINLESNEGGKSISAVRFDVYPAWPDYIEFVTGEIFANPDFGRLKDKPPIAC